MKLLITSSPVICILNGLWKSITREREPNIIITSCFHSNLNLLVWTGKSATCFKNDLLASLLDRAQGIPLGVIRDGWDQLRSSQDNTVGRWPEAMAAGGGERGPPEWVGTGSAQSRLPPKGDARRPPTPFWQHPQEGMVKCSVVDDSCRFEGLRYWRGSPWGRKLSRFTLWIHLFSPSSDQEGSDLRGLQCMMIAPEGEGK